MVCGEAERGTVWRIMWCCALIPFLNLSCLSLTLLLEICFIVKVRSRCDLMYLYQTTLPGSITVGVVVNYSGLIMLKTNVLCSGRCIDEWLALLTRRGWGNKLHPKRSKCTIDIHPWHNISYFDFDLPYSLRALVLLQQFLGNRYNGWFAIAFPALLSVLYPFKCWASNKESACTIK